MSNDVQHDEATIYDRSNGTRFVVRIPATSISSCIRSSPWLALLTTVGILLLVTDIPRTGSASIPRYVRQKVGPGVSMSWGPYDYHVANLVRYPHNSTAAQDEFNIPIDGTRDGEKLEYLDVWAYKQDSLSIAPRALVSYLNVTSYPACVRYHERCESATLPPRSVFTMLDGLIQAIETRLFPDPALEAHPFSFKTWSNWIDRLHHHVYLAFGRNPDMRSHALYYISSRGNTTRQPADDPFYLCGHPRQSHSSQASPVFCGDPIKWRCLHPTNRTSQTLVPIWNHIAIRFKDLQARYPGLDLDLAMFVSTFKETSRSNLRIVPGVAFVTDAIEVTTLIRGRQRRVDGEYRTVFIDDYRYERGAIESDEDEWAFYVFGLRWASQIYVWIRVWCLLVGCYYARAIAPKGHHETVGSKLIQMSLILFKIPGHVVVYGSWTPIIGYSLAHYFDSSLVQTIGEFTWSSVGGFYAFEPVEYVITATIQMRNIWMIALFWKIVSSGHSILRRFCSTSTGNERDGIVGLRGIWIGCVSWLSTFGFLRALSFRDTKIVRVLPLPRHIATSVVHVERNNSDYGIHFDIKCIFAAAVFVYTAGWLFQKLVLLTTGRKTSIFFSRSFYVPYSAGTLWSLSQLNTFWLVLFRGDRHGARVYADAKPTFASLMTQAKTKHVPSPSFSVVLANLHASKTCSVCGFEPSTIHWRGKQGCLHHEPILDIHRRTKALWSMVRLMNIANMTEPVALFRLYVTGRPLFVYRVLSEDQLPYTILLPTQIPIQVEPSDKATTSTRYWASKRDTAVVFELQRTVDSRDVPWHLLVNCG